MTTVNESVSDTTDMVAAGMAFGPCVSQAAVVSEIAGELSVSTSTAKTRLRNLHVKLGVRSRAEAVQSARALGLLAPSARSPAPA